MTSAQDLSSPSTKTSNPFSLLMTLWVTPTAAYQELKPAPRPWFPLIVLILAQVAVTVYYSMSVDFSWMMEQTLTSAGRDFTPEQQEAFERMQGGMGSTISAVAGSVAVLVMFSVIFSVIAGYFTLVSSFTADNIRFNQWFGFACWSATPMLLASLASCITIFLNSNGQIMQVDLNPLSFNSLIFKIPFGQPGATLLSSLDITTVCSLALQVIGYKTWTQKPIMQSFLIAAMPFIAIAVIVSIIVFI